MSRRTGMIALAILFLASFAVQALEPKNSGSYLDQKEFFKPELYISSSHEPIKNIVSRLPNRAVWEGYLKAEHDMNLAAEAMGSVAPRLLPSRAFIDPRSGAVSSLMGSFPLIPGRGVGNHVKLADLSMRLGRDLQKLDPKSVGDLVLAFIRDNSTLLGIDTTQLGNLKASEIHSELWQVNVPQTYKGIPVRFGRLAASLNGGNLVLIGTETWGDVKGLSHVPKITGQQAIVAGYAYAGGASAMDKMLRQPALEIVPVASDGPVGKGYKHRLVWSFAFRRAPDDATWEVIVDAHDAEVLSFQDINDYINHSITGGVYPVTSTGICPTNGTCGIMQSGAPMPFADTGLASPNNFTNSAGIFNWTSGTTTTTLTGQFVDIVDTCGAVSNSSTTGSIGL
ncbi:MAG TPA: endopeptidase, partial [Thermoanaerobaculia bacterium]|nr:endopeptidase [Thermoanaerobaculia bacterium]